MIRASDGAAIAFEEAGPREAQPIVFLHGFGQSRAVWRPLLESALAADFRLVAVDLRGHGESDGPSAAEAYGERLGEDLHDLVGSLGLVRPIVVGWSYGGVPIGDYLRRHGSGALGGIFLVAASMRLGKPARELFGPAMMSNARALLSDDPAAYELGARAFLSGCTSRPLPPPLAESTLAAMLRVPAHVRRAYLSRSDDFSAELAQCAVPLATVHGDDDRVVLPAMSELVARVAPAAQTTFIEGAGHASWLDAPAAFDVALRGLAARVSEVSIKG